MNDDTLLSAIRAHTQSLFDKLNAKIDARFNQLQSSIDAVATESQLTHGIVVRLQAQELLKAKIVTADADSTREERAARDTLSPPGGNGGDHD